jgi:parallel beta-helix repeat protein
MRIQDHGCGRIAPVVVALVLALGLAPCRASDPERSVGSEEPAPCTRELSAADDVQRAVDSAGPRAVVCLQPGEFRLRRFLALARGGVVVRGSGDRTVLRLDDGLQSPVVVIGDAEARVPRRPTSNVTLERLRIVGGGTVGAEASVERPYLTNSAVVVRGARDVVIRNTSISACRSACILTEQDTRRILIEQNDVSGSVWDGMALNRTAQARVTANTIHDNVAAGISAEHLEDSRIERNVIRENGTHGLYLSDSYRNTIAGNRFVENVLSGVFLTCAVRRRDPPVRCWTRSMSAANVFDGDTFVADRVAYMVGADGGSSCGGRGFRRNLSRREVFERTPREDPRATVFGRCLVYDDGRRAVARNGVRDR